MSYEQISSGQVIDNINTFLEVDDIPYYLTKYAHQQWKRIDSFSANDYGAIARCFTILQSSRPWHYYGTRDLKQLIKNS